MPFEKRHVSLASLTVVSLIAVTSLLFDLRVDGRMTSWGIRALGLTLVTLVLGIAAEMLARQEEIRKEKELAAKDSERDLILRSVEAHARAANAPLMPFSLFFTLRHHCPPEAIHKIFKDKKGYGNLSKKLKLVFVGELGGHGIYNAIKEEPNESHCTLQGEELEQVIENAPGMKEYVIKSVSSCEVNVFVPSSEEPALSLRTKFPEDKPRYVRRIQLFDDVIYEDAYFDGWQVTNASGKSWSVFDLIGTRIEISLRILSFDDINLKKPPRLHNLHLYFGRSTPYVLYFKDDQLRFPHVGESTKPVIKSNFYKPLVMSYEIPVDQDFFSRQVKQVF